MHADARDFREFLFLVDRDVDNELDEILWVEKVPRIAEWLIEILNDWRNLGSSLSLIGQNTVLWRIIGNPMFVGSWLNTQSELSLGLKLRFVNAAKEVSLALPELHGPDAPAETAYYMWWDCLASGVQDREVADLCLQILSDLSLQKDPRVQAVALHGLGHLAHPDRPAAVDLFLQFHPEHVDSEWIQQCRNGDVM